MQLSNPSKAVLSGVVTLLSGGVGIAAMCTGNLLAPGQKQSSPAAEAKSRGCPNADSGLTLPAGFCATVFADSIGPEPHMAVAPSGGIYVETWAGSDYGND